MEDHSIDISNLWKDFTVIDFWGIFIPGAIFVFLSNGYFQFTQIYSNFMCSTEENVVNIGKLLYMVGISYIIGSLFHEVSDWLERLLSLFTSLLNRCSYLSNSKYLCPFWRKRAFLWLSPKEQETIQEKFPQLNGNGSEKSKEWVLAMNKIRTTLDITGNISKHKMFESFRVMSRNTSVVLGGLLIKSFSTSNLTEPQMQKHFYLSILLISLFTLRALHYSFLKYKYAYETYCVRSNFEADQLMSTET